MQDFVLSSQVRMGSNLYFWRGELRLEFRLSQTCPPPLSVMG
jgi:hypothetical protein